METMLLERTTPIDALFSFIGAERVTVSKDADQITLTPAEDDGPDSDYIDPDDYPDTTAYLNALPGVAERLIDESNNLPRSAFKPVPREFFNV